MKKIAAANQGQFQETFLKPKRHFDRGSEIISNISHWVPFVINVFMKHISKISLREWTSGLLKQENWPLFYLTFAIYTLLFKTHLTFQKYKKTTYVIDFFHYNNELLHRAFMSRHIHKETSFDKTLEKNLRKLAQYELKYKQCNQKCEEYEEILGIEPLYAREAQKIIAEGEDINQYAFLGDVCYTSLTKVAPVGLGLDPEYMTKIARTQKIFDRAMECDEIKCLYIEAMMQPHPETRQTGSWQLVFDSKEKDKELNFGAYCSRAGRLICIDEEINDDAALCNFVFELTNAASGKRFEHLHHLVLNDQISREEYAKQTEKIEHEGCFRQQIIMAQAIKKLGWDAELMEYCCNPIALDFETVWPLLRDGSHTESYRQQWDSIRATASSRNDF
ncbi:MAG: hypothetical protein ABSA17_07790 [Rhabdochlamydiaceae bacterium]|jgi:hypothetical protein